MPKVADFIAENFCFLGSTASYAQNRGHKNFTILINDPKCEEMTAKNTEKSAKNRQISVKNEQMWKKCGKSCGNSVDECE